MIKKTFLRNNRGFALVAVMVSMILLIVVGVATMRSSNMERDIAGIDKFHTENFYGADSGLSIAAEILEQNIACPLGFEANDAPDALFENYVRIPAAELHFWFNNTTVPANLVSDTNRTFYFPDGYTPGEEHTNVLVWNDATGNNQGSRLGSLLMAAGYEGAGKSGANSGVSDMMRYNVTVQHVSDSGSTSIVAADWIHSSAQEGDCEY